MPRKKTTATDTLTILRQSAEQKYAHELDRLKESDKAPKPQGWQLSAHAVRKFILGDDELGISQKFYGDDALVDRSLVTLMGKQGLMLVGEPGTAKSMLSELLSAGISGNSNHTVQGTAGTTEDHIKYSWNYALLLSQGPSESSLIPSPIYHAMKHGKIARFEEITRCPAEIQDVMISLLSEKRMMIPEMGQDYALEAQIGFNVIATANLRDRGVHDMSSALKRRFNFETVKAIKDRQFEIELINTQLKQELKDLYKEVKIHQNVIEILVTVFNELRTGQSHEGASLKTPNAVMSSAEAVNIAHSACLQAIYLGNGELSANHIAEQLAGVVFKDNKDDAKKLSYYLDTVVKERGKKDKDWQAFYQGSKGFE
ncbi:MULTISPECIES: AAA family ATPase [Moraxella]|uniref:AAA family ATPase n=1 Tax=Moraxella lacunata TaxID=477 RepID=A0A1B8PVQ3_MORLA|nr:MULTISPECIES: AAA family ATPase [Moraxella]MBE9578748.1 AAA family ATPase [Moraxella sp. K1664]MBE9587984.1 AAA family ATPase [Moraxella sp. K1630]MBE9590495.1 AAA family ATPase [Moraxella sp. K127]MBE9596347.1 AAA family ATPase [Moraxella sp. K2450]MDH9218561.1 AAA family ATPase [Moraxella lacunata]